MTELLVGDSHSVDIPAPMQGGTASADTGIDAAEAEDGNLGAPTDGATAALEPNVERENQLTQVYSRFHRRLTI